MKTGLKLFDPYNIVTLRAISMLDFSVLVQKSDVDKVERLPNLLSLKKDLRVKFHVYSVLEDIVRKEMACIFPKGALVYIDNKTLFNTSPGPLFTSLFIFVFKRGMHTTDSDALRLLGFFNFIFAWIFQFMNA